MFVPVFSDRRHWCRKYELEALEQPQVRDLLEKQFIPVAVDNDRQVELGKKLGAELVPTTLILAPDGQKLLTQVWPDIRILLGTEPARETQASMARCAGRVREATHERRNILSGAVDWSGDLSRRTRP